MLTNEKKQQLVDKAVDAWKMAYAPYSNYSVGAAALTKEGEVFTGANIENAVYPLTICGERVAIFNAVSNGHKAFEAIAVVTRNGGTPCGSCRQVMAEFGMETLVLIANSDGEILQTVTVKDLLPSAFSDADLKSA
ncbi:MAG: cytidine deaminase [Brevefilum sp.]